LLDIAKVPAVQYFPSADEPVLSGKSSPALREHVGVLEAASTTREGMACRIQRNSGHVGPFPRRAPTSSLFPGTFSAHWMSSGFFMNLALNKL
jgi:hypothetical protein